MNYIIKHFFSAEFIKFIIIGVINTLSTTVFAGILDLFKLFDSSLFQKLNITFVIGYILGLTISFFLNTCFTFKERPTLKKALKFPLSYIPNFIIQYLFVWIFKKIGIMSTFAYLAAAIVGIPVTFLVMKLFVYKKQ